MDTKLVIDTSSLINFTRFYYFDKYNAKTIYKDLTNFVINKIIDKKIIVIDKVFNEWYRNKYNKDIRDKIKNEIYKTNLLITEVQKLINNYPHKQNIKILNLSAAEMDLKLNDYESGKIADLYLIACCIELKRNKKKPILITEETRKNDGKIIQKIPTICRSENIEYRNIPYSLFEIYKNELKFDLNIN